MLSDGGSFCWAKINRDFTGFLKNVETLDFKEVTTVSYYSAAKKKRIFGSYKVVCENSA